MSKNINSDYILAGSLDATTETLQLLSVSDVVAVRRRVAESAKTPVYTLATMAMDKDPEVRTAVGLNIATPQSVISRLVYDDNPDVRYWLASTSYLPKRFLIELMADSNPFVSQRAERTVLQTQTGLSQPPLTIFEFLEQDHLLLISKLEQVMEHYSPKLQDHIFDEMIDAFNGIKRHFERQRKFCLDKISKADGVFHAALVKNVDDCLQINEKIDSLIMRHVDVEADLYRELWQLLKFVLNHIEFAEKELFVALCEQIPQKQISEIDGCLNRALSRAAIC